MNDERDWRFLGVRLPVDLMDELDAFAAREERRRSEAVRILLRRALRRVGLAGK